MSLDALATLPAGDATATERHADTFGRVVTFLVGASQRGRRSIAFTPSMNEPSIGAGPGACPAPAWPLPTDQGFSRSLGLSSGTYELDDDVGRPRLLSVDVGGWC